MIKNLNPSLALKAWHSKVIIPYHNIIKAGDISFFCDASDIISIIEKIRGPIRSMSPADKQHTKKYVQNLCVLAEMYSKL